MPAAANKWAFLAAPVVAVTTSFLAVAVLPYGPPFKLPTWGLLPEWLQGREFQFQIATIDVGLLFIFAITALGVYGVVLAGWAGNNKYSLIGGLRSSAQMFSYELALGLSFVGVIMLAGSFQIKDIVDGQAGWFLALELRPAVPGLPRLLRRGRRRGGAHALRPARGRDRARRGLPHRVLVDALRAHPDGRVHQHDHGLGAAPPTCSWAAGTPASRACPPRACFGFVFWGAKVAFLLFVFIWLRGTLPRFRYDQLMHFGWKMLIPVAAVWILVTATGVALWGW